jgi:iron complex outermembrane receptor protein
VSSTRRRARPSALVAFAFGAFGLSPEARAQPAPAQPLEVVTYGDPLAPPPKDPFAAGSVIHADRLVAPGLSAADVLRTQPGVAVSDTGGYGALSTASIRGATAAQTPVYLAGVRLNDDVGGWADLSLVPLWMLHRVEVYRSNAPLEGDQLGIGGAIFFEPRRPKGVEGSAGEMLGSFGARSVWANAGAGSARAAVMVGVRLEESSNDYPYVDDGGTVFNKGNTRVVDLANADAHTLDVWALGSLALGKDARVDLVVNEVERRQGMPLAVFPTREARAAVSRQLVALNAHLPCGKPGCALTATTSLLVSATAYDDPLREVDLDATHLDALGTRVEEALLAHVPVLESLSLTPSARVSLEQLALTPLNEAPVRAERASGRLALGADWQAHRLLALRATGSLECDGTVARGATPWAGSTSGGATGETLRPCGAAEPAARLGVQVGSKPVALLINGGRYARVPTLGELYGISGAVRGNASLAPEHGLSADLGVRASAPSSWKIPELAIDAFGFARYATDLIAYERASAGFVEPFNVGAARVLGAEVAATVTPVRGLRVDVALTFLDPRDVSSGRTTVNDILPYQARLVLTPRVEGKIPVPARALRSVKLAASYFYEVSRYADPAGLVVVPAQGSLDLEAELALLDDHLLVRGRMADVLDQTRVDFVGYPLPGRSGYASMEARW